jgi:MtN3 and saliva related transmembrane protein
MNEFSLYVGIGAGIFTGISMLPQLFKIIKSKKAEDISYFMLAILLVGVGGWVWYGIIKNDYPIIITNAFSFLVNLAIFGFSIRYK